MSPIWLMSADGYRVYIDQREHLKTIFYVISLIYLRSMTVLQTRVWYVSYFSPLFKLFIIKVIPFYYDWCMHYSWNFDSFYKIRVHPGSWEVWKIMVPTFVVITIKKANSTWRTILLTIHHFYIAWMIIHSCLLICGGVRLTGRSQLLVCYGECS